MIRLQEWIHRFEVGEGTRTVRLVVAILALLGLTAVYDLREYRNFSTAEAMDAAQLARNIAAGKGYTTEFIRPLSIHLVEQHQIKLLRFLGERTFERVGSNKTLTADVRLVTATNKNLEEQVKSGAFREDLYFRLKVVEIRLPPLRERTGDIPLLAQDFLREFARENDKKVNDFAVEALEALTQYGWPGNVRELRTAIEHAVVLCRGEKITPRDLPPNVRGNGAAQAAADAARLLTQNDLTVQEAEKQLIIRALKESNGNRTLAAKKIGISRRTLHRKLHTYHLEGF